MATQEDGLCQSPVCVIMCVCVHVCVNVSVSVEGSEVHQSSRATGPHTLLGHLNAFLRGNL